LAEVSAGGKRQSAVFDHEVRSRAHVCGIVDGDVILTVDDAVIIHVQVDLVRRNEARSVRLAVRQQHHVIGAASRGADELGLASPDALADVRVAAAGHKRVQNAAKRIRILRQRLVDRPDAIVEAGDRHRARRDAAGAGAARYHVHEPIRGLDSKVQLVFLIHAARAV
jgi:hypothetical protein